jgi:probable selenium-dependent hydroxylase accessory protein YqeC
VPAILDALELRRGDVVAVVGAGGKTTLVYALAEQARSRGWSVLVTTTTHMGTLPAAVTGPVLVEQDGALEPALRRVLQDEGRATLLGRRIRSDKLEGIAPERVDALAACADLVLVEADGARGRSLKLPASHEPVVPRSSTLVVVLAAADVLGRPLDETRAHRLDQVVAATGRAVGEPVRESDLVAALRHAAGYPSRVPPRARLAAFLNKVEDAEARGAARRIASALQPPYDIVLAGSARGGEVEAWR